MEEGGKITDFTWPALLERFGSSADVYDAYLDTFSPEGRRSAWVYLNLTTLFHYAFFRSLSPKKAREAVNKVFDTRFEAGAKADEVLKDA